MPFFITNVLPGEEVTVRVLSSGKNHCFARPEEIKKPAAERIDPPCPYYPLCGGCQFLHTPYANQVRIKERILEEFLSRIMPEQTAGWVIPHQTVYYKNSVRCHVEGRRPGFRQRHTDIFVPVRHCLLLDRRINMFLSSFLFPDRPGECRIKVDNRNNLSSDLYHQRKSCLDFRLDGLSLEYDHRTFFQSNSYLIVPWLELIREEARAFSLKRVLDLYCGVGILTLYLARHLPVKKITGLEIDNTAVNYAKRNRVANRIFQAHFQAGDVLASLGNYENASLVILNPPRGGAGREVISRVADLRPGGIIISSCEISNFTRDAEDLKERGYACRKLIPLDMFPHTYHFEVIGIFTS